MSGPPGIPATWDDLTTAWFTAVLAQVDPAIEVASFSLLHRSDGSNRRAGAALTYAAGSGPEVVFLKAEGAHREVHARNGNLFNEPRLAASGLLLPVDHPQPYAVLIDEPGLDWLVVMEDVTHRGADPRDATRPMSVAQATNGLRGLARLHRRYWGFTAESEPELAWVQTWEPTEGFQLGLRLRVPTGMHRAADLLPPGITKLSGDEIVDLWARYVDLLDRDPVTLLHADTHVGNTYVLPGDEVGFLDWQVARRGNWSQDVGHFFQGAVTIADRRASERGAVDAYVATLGTDIGRDEAWLWYRASAAYGLAIWLSTLGVDGYQSPEVSRALVERFATAFVDLDTRDALATLEAREALSPR